MSHDHQIFLQTHKIQSPQRCPEIPAASSMRSLILSLALSRQKKWVSHWEAWQFRTDKGSCVA